MPAESPLRRAARRVLLPPIARLQRARRARMSDRERWELGIESEVGFWRGYLAEAAADPANTYLRADYAFAEDPIYAKAITALAGTEIEALDVGAGPLSALPKVHPGKTIHITAYDPLAEAYDRLLAEAGIDPIVRTQAGAGEDIAALVGKRRFDLTYASNALDHGYDPPAIVAAMVEITRPGGLVLLRHERNEAVNEHYQGLHQWNFDVRDGDFVIWRPGVERNVSRELGDKISTEVVLTGREIVCYLTRLGANTA